MATDLVGTVLCGGGTLGWRSASLLPTSLLPMLELVELLNSPPPAVPACSSPAPKLPSPLDIVFPTSLLPMLRLVELVNTPPLVAVVVAMSKPAATARLPKLLLLLLQLCALL